MPIAATPLISSKVAWQMHPQWINAPWFSIQCHTSHNLDQDLLPILTTYQRYYDDHDNIPIEWILLWSCLIFAHYVFPINLWMVPQELHIYLTDLALVSGGELMNLTLHYSCTTLVAKNFMEICLSGLLLIYVAWIYLIRSFLFVSQIPAHFCYCCFVP